MALLLTNATLATMTDGYGLIPDAGVAMEGGRILWAGPMAELPGQYANLPRHSAGGRLVTPALIDCHSPGTAAAALYRAEGREMDPLPAFRFVTGSLHVDYLKPTPLAGELEIRGRVKEIKGRKVVVECTVLAGGVITARGEVVAVQMPESFGQAAS